MSVPSNEQMAVLETMIDKHGLFDVVFALSVICGDKADHIRASYNDKFTANAWGAAANRLSSTAVKVDRLVGTD